ncbi:hypothetical protein ACOXXX_17070 [Thalassococcus sp. BH17M4-6]|uniref:hypothetical protein n=1 Tax=Thalassococcus sp. BH17M4-6 TaxID=3413148 RepID=UPI003BCCD029
MPRAPSSYAALILPDACGLDVDPYLVAAHEAITARDIAPGSEARVLHSIAQVSGDTIRLTIATDEDGSDGPRVVITATACPNARFSEERAARILSDTVMAALEFSDADLIEWFTPDTVLEAEEFVDICSYVSPRRTHEAEPEDLDYGLPPINPETLDTNGLNALFREQLPDGCQLERQSHLTERLLAHCEALRDTKGDEFRMQAASWAMTGTVACIAPPVGASMTVVGAARGMNFRRVTQALTLSALFVVLQNQGVIAQLSSTLMP